MTRQQFIDSAVRKAERAICVPPGWWGTWRDVTNGLIRVTRHRSGWVIRRLNWSNKDKIEWTRISKHASRADAMRKARLQ